MQSQPRGSFDIRWKDALQQVEIDPAGYTGPKTFLPTQLAGLGLARQVRSPQGPCPTARSLVFTELRTHSNRFAAQQTDLDQALVVAVTQKLLRPVQSVAKVGIALVEVTGSKSFGCIL